ncbi:putative membrane protein YecN with MAPEG domain [Povalibacter uvarum]|uniref:Putative membrane protein YecN with MAPEG domain n=1 Tax=Povalibacter uvarum TaxID=732238 RepID=A0A841HIQ6_9GAMM|nr:MAPEG family protein [Povalibacter uvarum]MBB6093071.1 putative membrane protein YecN with MAPEG domain [Povalibacter uvarum]
MDYVAIVTALALIQFLLLGILVGRARKRYGVAAPATTGHEMFDRWFRVHMNTAEQLLLFVPSMWIYAYYWNPVWAAGIGSLFLIGRTVYAITYIRDPKSRSLGFLLTFIPIFVFLVGTLVGAIRSLIAGG